MAEFVLLIAWALVVGTAVGAVWGTRRGRRILQVIAGLLGLADDLLALLAVAAVLALVVAVAGLRILALLGWDAG